MLLQAYQSFQESGYRGYPSKQNRNRHHTNKNPPKNARILLIRARRTQSEGINIHKRLMIFSDGGARGNPGPAAAAFIVLSENGQVLAANSRYLGLRTNNQAEYEALIAALQFAATVNAEEVICHLDSELVAKQLTGEYTVKNSELRKLWRKIQELNSGFKNVRFVSVPRTNIQIQKADVLVNAVLDEFSQHSGEKIPKL
jgi:ribonuclease HI